jgi:hypothetical protein
MLINPEINLDLGVAKERLYQEYINFKRTVYLVFFPLLLWPTVPSQILRLYIIILMVMRYLLALSMTILLSPLTTVSLTNAKLILVEHYFFHQVPPTFTSAILASKITMVVIEMTFMWIFLLASTFLKAVVSIRRCARRVCWVIEFIAVVIGVSYRITVQKNRFESVSFFFFLVFILLFIIFFLFIKKWWW